jgi:4-hydroxybenzoyl-CoA thioesterase
MSLYTRTHRVAWGDCDPAGILYTPRVFDYCNQTLECWYRDVLGSPWMKMIAGGTGSPMVHVECDFIRQMAPDLELVVSIRIERLGTSSMTFLIDGVGPQGDAHFAAKYVVCITDFKTAAAIPIPPDLRERAEAYERATRSGG